MRLGLIIATSAFATTLVLAPACTSFNSEPLAADAVPDAAPDAAPDSAPDAGAVLCTLPEARAGEATTCAGDCTAKPLYEQVMAEQAVVAGLGVYIVKQQSVLFSNNVYTGTFTKLDDGPALMGAPTQIAVDAEYVYASTSAAHVRVPVGGGMIVPLVLENFDASPLVFGTKAFFQRQPTRVLRALKDGTTSESTTAIEPEALAVDGDAAYWIGKNSASEHVMLGPFPSVKQVAPVTSPVLGFAVRAGAAYVAEFGTKGGSRISRIALRDGARAALVDEPGKIESLTFDGEKLYWVALRFPAAGTRVLVSLEPCAGEVTVLATELQPLAALSFNGENAFATATTRLGPIYRMRK